MTINVLQVCAQSTSTTHLAIICLYHCGVTFRDGKRHLLPMHTRLRHRFAIACKLMSIIMNARRKKLTRLPTSARARISSNSIDLFMRGAACRDTERVEILYSGRCRIVNYSVVHFFLLLPQSLIKQTRSDENWPTKRRMTDPQRRWWFFLRCRFVTLCLNYGANRRE